MVHIEYLVEDASTEVFVNTVMKRIVAEYRLNNVTYNCVGFHGIGNIPQKNTVSDVKMGRLLQDLPKYLRGFSRSLQGINAVVIVIADNDDREQDTFRDQVQDLINQNAGTLDNILCIAVEELEAWLLGDENAIMQAFPRAKRSVIRNYAQDSICGTWEVLADAIYHGGVRRLKKDAKQYHTIGKMKCEWAEKIGANLSLNGNRSPSFNRFKDELFKRLGIHNDFADINQQNNYTEE